MEQNQTIADVMVAILNHIQNEPGQVTQALDHLKLVEADLQEVVADLKTTQVPTNLDDAADVMHSSLQGLELLQQAAAKVRLFAQTRKKTVASEAEALAREGMQLVDAVRAHNEQRIKTLVEESDSEVVSDLKRWKAAGPTA